MSAQVAQSLMNRGLSKPSLYVFQIPVSEKTHYFSANEYVRYYCKAVSLPEVTHDVIVSNGHFRQGVVTQQPTGLKYAKPLSITMIERSDYFAYEQFRRWFNRTGNRFNSDKNDRQFVRYKDEYAVDITLRKLELPTFRKNEDGVRVPVNYLKYNKDEDHMFDNFRVAYEVTFFNAFPTSLATIDYGTDSRDTMVEYNVDFYYDTYNIKFNNDTERR